MRHIATTIVVFLSAMTPHVVTAQDTQDEPIDFGREVRPLLAKRCFHCHGPDKGEGGLRLHRKGLALAELDSGSHAIVPSDVAASALIERVTADDEFTRMPPEGKPLEEEEVALLRRWIESGAPWREHWAFQPRTQPEVPAVKNGAENSDWIRNPIDAFILARLQKNGLEPNPPADKRTLARRLYFDLTGLPPTPAQMEAYLADESTDAYENLVDRLLASKHYGERWARHWLDVVRYAETNSFERDGRKPNAWRYRDYVIRSLNEDKPFDRFIIEQLAGDELPEATADSITATAYYRLGVWDDEPADKLQAQFDEYDDIVSTTGHAFLALTINCARCHDHKIDPVPQTDYYRMVAFFRGLRSYGTRGDQTSNNQVCISSPELQARHRSLNAQRNRVAADLREIENRAIERLSEAQREQLKGPRRKKFIDEELPSHLSGKELRTYNELLAEQQTLVKKKLPPLQHTLGVARCVSEPPATHVLYRGNPHVPRDEVAPGFPSILSATDPIIPEASAGAATSGRRTVLAKWIASPENPLTARVAVNRVWQNHFGRGIVRTPNNFGQLGAPPTHPDLLDWLAGEFVASGWRLKPLHKQIVMSSTYRMSSEANAEALAADPLNELFWRFDMRRLSAEEIRDAIHVVNGSLNDKMHGPGFYSKISAEVMAGQSRPGSGWGKSSDEERARRSIYIHVKRSLITPILESFDYPETDTSCEGRFTTVQPTQALAMLNGEFAIEEAAVLADRLRREAGAAPEDQVKLAVRLVLARPATERDISRGLKLLETLQEEHGIDAETALNHYCLMMLNLNEFLYLD